MAKVSRSKQPAFDPSELDDLIFSPAVGRGVGSHLLNRGADFPASPPEVPAIKDQPDLSAVATLAAGVGALTKPDPTLLKLLHVPGVTALGLATVDMPPSSTVVTSPEAEKILSATVNLSNIGDPATEDTLESATVAMSHLATVDTSESPAESIPSTVDSDHKTTVDTSLRQSSRFSTKVKLWITEQGELIPEGRVKRIRLAQDVINSGEESVYNTLWAAKGSVDNETSRVVQAGYNYLVKRTRLAKKTIQRVIAKLIDKDFIAIERPADIYQRTSTVYRVSSYKAVLERHIQRGRTHVAKIGPGFSYVRPLTSSDLSTVVMSPMSTVANETRLSINDEALQQSRETIATADEVNQEQMDRAWGRQHEADLNDPTVPEEIKRVIRSCLGTSPGA